MAKILAIDDDPYTREIVERVLTRAGHQVVCVEDGIYAERAILEHNPNLILCDILMPKLDGYTLIEHLKFNSEFQGKKIMIMTSLGDDVKYIRREIAADGFIAKPFDNDDLVDKVEMLLNSKTVNIGIKKRDRMHENKVPKDTSPWAIVAAGLILGIIAFIGIVHFYQTSFLDPQINNSIAGDAQTVNYLSDKIFIVAIPIFVIISVYIVHLLKKLSVNRH